MALEVLEVLVLRHQDLPSHPWGPRLLGSLESLEAQRHPASHLHQGHPVHRPFLERHPSLVVPEVLGVLVLQGQVVQWGSVSLGLQDPGDQLGQVGPAHLAPPFVPSDLPLSSHLRGSGHSRPVHGLNLCQEGSPLL